MRLGPLRRLSGPLPQPPAAPPPPGLRRRVPPARACRWPCQSYRPCHKQVRCVYECWRAGWVQSVRVRHRWQRVACAEARCRKASQATGCWWHLTCAPHTLHPSICAPADIEASPVSLSSPDGCQHRAATANAACGNGHASDCPQTALFPPHVVQGRNYCNARWEQQEYENSVVDKQ